MFILLTLKHTDTDIASNEIPLQKNAVYMLTSNLTSVRNNCLSQLEVLMIRRQKYLKSIYKIYVLFLLGVFCLSKMLTSAMSMFDCAE